MSDFKIRCDVPEADLTTLLYIPPERGWSLNHDWAPLDEPPGEDPCFQAFQQRALWLLQIRWDYEWQL